jgi:hypothetical protein
VRQTEDANGDGTPERIIELADGVTRVVEEDTNGDGCRDSRQHFREDGSLEIERVDTDGDCEYDTHSYLEGGQVVRLEVDTNQNGVLDLWEEYEDGRRVLQAEARGRCVTPTMLFLFAEDGESVVTQEEDRNCNRRPDRLTRFDAEGAPTLRCTPRERIEFADGRPRVAFQDSAEPYDGYADRRQVYGTDGTVELLAVDTNGDRVPDVWIRHTAGQPTLQDEDTDFDGVVDQRFDLASDQAIEVNGDSGAVSLERLPRIDCSSFSDFWRR